MDILKNRNIYLGVSLVFFVFSVFLLIFGKLNLGIDMTGGIQMEYSYNSEINIDKITSELNKEKEVYLENGKQVINNIGVYGITGEKTVAVVVGFQNNTDEIKLNELKNNFKNKVFETIKAQDESTLETRYVNIGKSFGDYIKNTAFITLAISIIAITFYVTFAFSGVVSGVSIISFAFITIITLFHDVVIASGLYIFTSMYLPEFQIDTFFITALLTILGYSINDTIVVFDRIRSNLKKYAGKTGKDGRNLYEIINMSVTETMTRSVYTSLTVIFVLTTIMIFGPETISGFILVMIFGTIVGTYSSIYIASPILYIVNKDKKLTVYKKIEVNPEDKIVV
ncbi:MAG: protein translocase subunit SecF [Candidatus Gracilibacteria bacterium]|nr:protein translocase subunit SecF [Candidatus Gracilibacteria bacterium]